MTVGKAGLLTTGVVAAFAVGVMTGPTIRDNWSRMRAPQTAVAPPSIETSAPAPVKAERPRSAQGRCHRIPMKRSRRRSPQTRSRG